MEFILSKIISRSPRTVHNDCDISIVDKNEFINVPSDSAQDVENQQTGKKFDDNAALSGENDTVNRTVCARSFHFDIVFYFIHSQCSE